MRSNMKINFECGKPTCHSFMASPIRESGHRGRVSAVSRVCRKYRLVEHKKRQQMREYRNLKNILPAINGEPRVAKIDVVEEAIRYIDFLHTEIAARLRNSHYNNNEDDVCSSQDMHLPSMVMPNLASLSGRNPPAAQDNDRRRPLSEIRIRL